MKTTLVTALMLATLLALGCGPGAPKDAGTTEGGSAAQTADTHSADDGHGHDAATDAAADASADMAGTEEAATDTEAGTEAGGDATADAAGGTTTDGTTSASPVWSADEEKNATVSASGLKKVVITQGEGTGATVDNTVRVNYTGWLVNGTMFDSSVTPQGRQPAPFDVAPPWRVIEGWKEALVGMKKGEKVKLYIPANLAYGAQSPSPLIPANSDLIFEVEVLEIM